MLKQMVRILPSSIKWPYLQSLNFSPCLLQVLSVEWKVQLEMLCFPIPGHWSGGQKDTQDAVEFLPLSVVETSLLALSTVRPLQLYARDESRTHCRELWIASDRILREVSNRSNTHKTDINHIMHNLKTSSLSKYYCSIQFKDFIITS